VASHDVREKKNFSVTSGAAVEGGRIAGSFLLIHRQKESQTGGESRSGVISRGEGKNFLRRKKNMEKGERKSKGGGKAKNARKKSFLWGVTPGTEKSSTGGLRSGDEDGPVGGGNRPTPY